MLTFENLRHDGRLKTEGRMISMKLSSVGGDDGFCYYQCGLTQVKAIVIGPKQRKHGSNTLNVSFSMSPFSTLDRKKRSKSDRQCIDRGLQLQKIFEALVLLENFPRSQIDVSVEILQDHGSVMACAINAVMLALVDAGIPVKDLLSATTVGMVSVVKWDKTTPSLESLVDLNQQEQEKNNCTSVLTLALTSRNQKALYLLCEGKMDIKTFNEAYQTAVTACQTVAQTLKTKLTNHAIRHL